MTPEPFPSWDDFRFFLATTEAGSFSKAAGQLGMTQPTISRRIESLEQSLGVRLFDRLPSGVALTTRGESILDAARHIEDAVREIHRSVVGSDKRLEGPVRISVTDGLATYWMTPRLGKLQEKHPGISIEFQCSTEPADLLRMESDLSIQSRMPEAADLIAVKLGTFHFVPWASPEYLERHGVPYTPKELMHHRLLDHIVYKRELGEWSEWFALADAANLVTYKTNSSSSLASAIKAGLGIGMLPTYSCECVDGIVPLLDLDVKTRSDIRLVYHPDTQNTARVRAVIDWTKKLFKEKKTQRWFREEFHPPTSSKAKCGRVNGSR